MGNLVLTKVCKRFLSQKSTTLHFIQQFIQNDTFVMMYYLIYIPHRKGVYYMAFLFPYLGKLSFSKLELRYFNIFRKYFTLCCCLSQFREGIRRKHCVKSVQILNFFWSVFSCIWTEYRNLLRKSYKPGKKLWLCRRIV